MDDVLSSALSWYREIWHLPRNIVYLANIREIPQNLKIMAKFCTKHHFQNCLARYTVVSLKTLTLCFERYHSIAR